MSNLLTSELLAIHVAKPLQSEKEIVETKRHLFVQLNEK